MGPLQKLQNRARAHPQTIVLADGEEDRAIAAAASSVSLKIAKPALIGRSPMIRSSAERIGINLADIEIVDPTSNPRISTYAEILFERRRASGITLEEAYQLVRIPLNFAALRVVARDAHAAIAGLGYRAREVTQSVIQLIGLAPNSRILSTCALVLLQSPDGPGFAQNNALLFADCAVSDPSAQVLADVAIATAETARQLFEIDPRIALLSSLNQSRNNRVREASKIVRARCPDLHLVETDADLALTPSISAQSAVSPIAGRANVLVFPDGDSAEIATELLQGTGAATVLRPIHQGLAKPMNGLSRNASIDDIVGIIAATSIQAIAQTQLSTVAGN